MAEEKKLSEETKARIKSIAEEFNKKIEQTAADFKEIYNSPVVKEQKDRESIALRFLRAKYSAEFGQPTQEYQIYVLQKTSPRTVKKKETGELLDVSNVYAIGILPTEGEEEPPKRYVRITCFGNSAQLVDQVENTKFYSVKLAGGLKDGIFDLRATDITKFNLVEDAPEWDEPIDVLRNCFSTIDIAEAILKAGDGKLYLIEGNVTGVRPDISTQKGNKIGLYNMVDDSLTANEIQEMGGGIAAFVEPIQVKYAMYSWIAVLGRINKGDRGASISGELVIPIVAEPYAPPKGQLKLEDTGTNEENSVNIVLRDEDL